VDGAVQSVDETMRESVGNVGLHAAFADGLHDRRWRQSVRVDARERAAHLGRVVGVASADGGEVLFATGSLAAQLALVGWLACAIPSPQDFSVVWYAHRAPAGGSRASA
jgi:hypothetical protein